MRKSSKSHKKVKEPTITYEKNNAVRIYNFTVIFEKEEDGGYHVFCPVLPGCHSQGETYDEATKNIKEAVKLYLKSLKAHHEPIPDEDITINPIKITV
ncbi:MAG TPA: type II toxin-antitoxin system HicB family antitoxin [bacterium]|jgi:predicted RNase H-like HicB family nuclease